MKFQPQQLLNSLPELFLIVNRQGDYVDYFGGADESKYQDLDFLEGKGLSDFFDESLVVRFKEAIMLSLEKDAPAVLEYEIDEAGQLKNQSYRAELMPLKDSNDLVLMSVMNSTMEKDFLSRAYMLTNSDPAVSVSVMNAVAFKQNAKEFKSAHGDCVEFTVCIEDFDMIKMFCASDRVLDLENLVLAGMVKNLRETKHILGRTSPGCYKVLSNAGRVAVNDMIRIATSQFENTKVTARTDSLSFPVTFTVIRK